MNTIIALLSDWLFPFNVDTKLAIRAIISVKIILLNFVIKEGVFMATDSAVLKITKYKVMAFN